MCCAVLSRTRTLAQGLFNGSGAPVHGCMTHMPAMQAPAVQVVFLSLPSADEHHAVVTCFAALRLFRLIRLVAVIKVHAR